MTTSAALAYNAALRARAAQAVTETLKAFAAVSVTDIDGTFTDKVVAGMLAGIVRGQLLGASTAVAYHLGLLAANKLTPAGPAISPAGFASGMQTAEGYDLRRVVALAPIRIKQRIGEGVPPDEALDSGRAFLASVADSEVQDAARGAMDVALNTDSQYAGYLRTPNPDACGRCLILAGRLYRADGDFLRHPQSACTAEPVLAGQDDKDVPSARDHFEKLTEPEQDRAFGADGAEAIRSGADPASVVNARSGMRAAGDSFTTQGTSSKRGKARYPKGRLSPLGCRQQADGDQGRYLELLAVNGYIQQ